MKKSIVSVLALTCAGLAQAYCSGSGSSYHCSDASGNSYNVQRYGNATHVQGYNAGTGSSWTQNSQTYGNTTYMQGSTNGNAWNQTITTSPGMTNYSGTDSRGSSFQRTCNAFGCH